MVRITSTCIPPELVEQVKKLNINKMTSEERTKALSEVLGDETGKNISVLYERTLLLKNQERAFKKFIQDIDGISIEKKEKMLENFQNRVAEKNGIIKDNELLAIVKDTLDRKYDLEIPDDKVKKMFDIRNEIDELKTKFDDETPDSSPERLAYGAKVVELSKVVDSLKQVSQSIKGELELAGQRITGKAKDKEWFGMVGQVINEIGNIVLSPAIKSVKASLDNSVLFRQGLKVLSADPETFGRQAGNTWNMWTKVLSKEAMEEMSDAFKADLVSRKLYQDAIKAKLAIGVVEDFFPTSIVQKIPGLGNLFKASDEAFTMFSQGSRMDLFEKYVGLFKEANGGAMPDADMMKQFAKIANSTTGRGGLGSFEASAGTLNKFLFSARYQTANLNTFRHAFTMTGEAGKIARIQAAKHLALIGGIMTAIGTFTDVGWNPKESTFGKARIPGTTKWVDLTGSLGSYFSVIGKSIEKIQNPEYKDTAMNVIVDFMKGKLAPVPGVGRDILEQRDYSGNKPTVASVAQSLFVPITLDNPIKDYQKDFEAGTIALSSFIEFLGGSVTQPSAKMEGSYKSPLDLITGR